MIKRPFGMACLNITQGRFSSPGSSHHNINAYDLGGMDTGIDRYRAYYPLECISIQTDDRTGFANTVCFYDKDNDVTLAMTHVNEIPSGMYVGRVYDGGETCYFEGTEAGASKFEITGNHIHLEIGHGRQKGKTKINGEWQLKNAINIEDYFYIDEEYSWVKNDGGYYFSYKKPGEATMTFQDGFQEIQWNGNKLLVAKMNLDTQDIGMMSAKGSNLLTAVQTIDKIDDDRIHYFKMNCNYFQMLSGQADPVNTHYGAEQTPTVNIVPRPGNKSLLALWIDKDLKPHMDYTDNYWLQPPDVKLVCTPAAIMLLNGEDQDIISTAFGDKRNLKNSQSMFLRCSDGSYAFAVTTNDNWNAYNCRQFAKDYGCTMCALMDSGGSSQLVVNGQKKLYTGRSIPNVLTIFKKGSDAGMWGMYENTENEDKPTENEPTVPSDDEVLIEELKTAIAQLNKQLQDKESEYEACKSELDMANGRIHNMQTVLETIHSLSEDAMSMNFKVYDDMAEALESLGIGKDDDKGE